MTVSSSSSKAGPYTGNGVTVAFDFAFKVFTSADLRVVLTSTAGVDADLTLTTNYTVSINADQEAAPGGEVTCLVAPATGEKITILREVTMTQGASLPNQGGWYPEVVEDALDKLTMIAQQQEERLDRTLQVGVTETDPQILIDAVNAAATAADASADAAALSETAAATSVSDAAAQVALAAGHVSTASGYASAASASAAAAAAAGSVFNDATYWMSI